MDWVNAKCVEVDFSIKRYCDKEFHVKVPIDITGAVPDVPQVIMVGENVYVVQSYSPLTYVKRTFGVVTKISEEK